MLYWLIAAIFFTMLYLTYGGKNQHMAFMALEDDSDMKIVGLYPGHSREASEPGADESARIFLSHKDNGNIMRAKNLGALYGEWLVNEGNPVIEYNLCKDEQESCYQRYLLCAYVISMTVNEKAADHIISNVVMTEFYEFLRDNSPRLYNDITDSAAFSLYILRARTHRNVDEAMGRVFSVLCAHDDEPEYIETGRRIYSECSAHCSEMFSNAGFVGIS